MNILIVGNYGATNLGDEAILEGILKEFGKERLTVLSNSPSETSKLHTVNYRYLLPFGLRSLFRGIFKLEFFYTIKAIYSSDLILLGGGGLFTDEKIKAIFLWAYQFIIPRILGKKVWMYGQSVGPLKRNFSKKIVRFVFNKSYKISVRDNKSKELLEKIGVTKEIEIIKDPAFNLKNDLKLHDSLISEKYVVLSLRDWSSLTLQKKKELAKFCDYLVEEKSLKIVFIPFQKMTCNDSIIGAEIKCLMKHQKEMILNDFEGDIYKVLSIIKSAKLLIGMRLHSLIFADIVGTPFIALAYSDKVWGILEEIGKKEKGIKMDEIMFERMVDKFKNI